MLSKKKVTPPQEIGRQVGIAMRIVVNRKEPWNVELAAYFNNMILSGKGWVAHESIDVSGTLARHGVRPPRPKHLRKLDRRA